MEAGGTARMVAALAKALREQAGLTQEELGKLIDYTASAISAMETCAQPASDKMLVKLEEVLGGGLGVFEKARKWMLLEKYPARFRGVAGLERGAVTISSYESFVIDGHLPDRGVRPGPHPRQLSAGLRPEARRTRRGASSPAGRSSIATLPR